MILLLVKVSPCDTGIPRESGDDPIPAQCENPATEYSLRERG